MINDKLNAAWVDNTMQTACFEFRALAEKLYDDLLQAKTRIDELVALPVFAGIDAEIKTEGQAIRTIINTAKTSLDGHQDFLRWRRP